MPSDFAKNVNIDHLMEKLQNPRVEPEALMLLQKLLVEQQNKLGRNREQLELAEERVQAGSERISKLKFALATWNADKRPRNRDLSVVATMERTQRLLEDFRNKLRDELFPYCVMVQNNVMGIVSNIDEARRHAQEFANCNPDLVVTLIDRSNGDSNVVSPEDDTPRFSEIAVGTASSTRDSPELAELAERLEKARRAVAGGETDMHYQRDVIARLKKAKVNTSEARAVLDTLAKRQAERVESLAYIMRHFSPER